MAHRESKEASPESPLPSGERPRSEWSKRLDLFRRGGPGTRAGGSEGPREGEWEEIRAHAPHTTFFGDALASDEPNSASLPDPAHEELELGLQAARRDIADREAENVGLRGALGAAHQQLRAREAEITDLTTRLAVAHATTTARQDELANLGSRYSGVDEKRAALEREVQLLREKLQRAAEEAEKREIKIENLRATRATLEETVEARDRIIAARDEELGACEQELQAHRDRIANQYKSLADRDAEMALLGDQLLAEQERSRQLELELGARDQMLDHQREKLAERDEQLANLLATFDVMERTLKTRPGVSDLAEGETSTRAPAADNARAAPAMKPATPSRESASPAPPPTQPTHHHGSPHDEPREESDAMASSIGSVPAVAPASEDPDCREDDLGDPDVALAIEDESATGSNRDDLASERMSDDEREAPSPASDEAEEDPSDAEEEDEALENAQASTPECEASPGADAFAAELDVLDVSGDLLAHRPAPRTAIFGWWRDQRIAEHLSSLDVRSFDALLERTVARACEARPDDTISILSLCGADPELELRLARSLRAKGHENFAITCLDDRESWHDARANAGRRDGLEEVIDTLAASRANLPEDAQFDVFLADGALECVADLPALLGWIRQAWKDDSVMVLGAALASSAAGESPENVETVDRIWNVMPDAYMHNHRTGAEQPHYTPSNPPSDAAGQGGPLATGSVPLLPLLLDEFCFEVFAPFGNLINAFVGPEVGPNFDPEDEADRSFIERFAKLDEGQIDAGAIHPIHLVAVLSGTAGEPSLMIDNRAPERCLALGE